MSTIIVEHGQILKASDGIALQLPLPPVFSSYAVDLIPDSSFYRGSASKALNILIPIATFASIGTFYESHGFYFTNAIFSVLLPSPVFNSLKTHELTVRGLQKLHPNDTGKIIAFGETFLMRFSYIPTTGYDPLTVVFYNNSQSPVDSWAWSFGDGETSTEKNPTHTFNTYGNFTVILTSGNAEFGYFSVSAVITVRDRHGIDFLGTPLTGTAPMDVLFEPDTLSASLEWSFGDGTISRETTPIHRYMMPGVYTVTVRARFADSEEVFVTTKTDYIRTYQWAIGEIGGLNVSRTNKCLRVGIKPGQGGIFEITGAGWPFPEARTGTLLVYDENGQAHALVLDANEGKFVDISTEDTPFDTKVYKDKVGTDGSGGTDYEPEVYFAPDTGNMEHYRVRLAESHLYTQPVKSDDRGETGFDANGYPTGMTAEMTFFKDGEKINETAKAEDIALPKGEIRTDREIEGSRIETRVKFNAGKVQLIGREQYFVAGDVPDNPDDRMATEDDYQEELAAPTRWLSRGTGLIDRATGNELAGAYTAITGPDGNTDSAHRITSAIGLANSAIAAGTILLWRKTGYTISGVSLADVGSVGDWFLSYATGSLPANISLGAGDVFDVRLFSTVITAKCRTYIYDNVNLHGGDNVLPGY
jgi:PKD repeat protein